MTTRLGRALRIATAAAGIAMFVVAARYAAVYSADVRPGMWLRWLVTAAVVHDVVVAPATIVAGWLVARFAPTAAKAPLQVGLIVSGVTVVMAWPALRGYGRIASNPTYLPRSYTTGLVLTLGLVWAACAGWAVVRHVRSRSRLLRT